MGETPEIQPEDQAAESPETYVNINFGRFFGSAVLIALGITALLFTTFIFKAFGDAIVDPNSFVFKAVRYGGLAVSLLLTSILNRGLKGTGLRIVGFPGWFWVKMRSMKFALILLLIAAGASIIGTLLPQEAMNAYGTYMYEQNNPGIAPVLRQLGFFDVYGVWWFQVIIGLVLFSIFDCVWTRSIALAKRWKNSEGKPANKSRLERTGRSAQFESSLQPAEAVSRFKQLMRSGRWRMLNIPGKENQVYAEKGYNLRELGNLLFHFSMLLLLVGVIYGKSQGFDGSANIMEGQTWVDTRVNYDDVKTGVFFGEKFSGMEIKVDDFTVTHHPNGMPKNFQSTLRVLEDGKEIKKEKIRVNGKLIHKGVKFYQSGYGWAPVLKVTDEKGKAVINGPTIFVGQPHMAEGVLKITRPRPQIGIQAWMLPDPQYSVSGDVSAGTSLKKDPILIVEIFEGDLRLNVPQSVYSLDKTYLQSKGKNIVRLGEEIKTPNGYTISFPELKEYTGLQIAKDSGIPIVYTSFGICVIGLYILFYVSRRRLWAVIEPGPNRLGSLIFLGGTPLKDESFRREFERVIEQSEEVLAARESKAPPQTADNDLPVTEEMAESPEPALETT